MGALPRGKYEIYSETISVRGPDGFSIDAYRARPETMPISGLVVHPDLMGLRPMFEAMADQLATHGLAVIVVEPFARIPAAERAALDVPGRMALVPTLEDELQLGDLAAAADRLVVDDDCSRVGVLGFCMGGMQALKAAAIDRFDAAVAFYGMLHLPEEWQGPEIHDALETAANVCPTLAIFGGVDKFTPAADIQELRDAWTNRVDCEIVVYPEADHAFVHAEDRPSYRADDAADAWRRALAWVLP
jgi:carboxymethylenebutenolidase